MDTKQRKPARQPAGQKRPVRKRRRSESEVVYTPAQHFDKYKFLLRLATVVAIVLALVLGMAIFFKVEVVNVAGARKYTPYDILQASGIQVTSENGPGENLLTLNKFRAGGKIRTALPYVDKVKISIKLPDTVNIEITELEVVYAIADSEGGWWLMDAGGNVVEQIDKVSAINYAQIQGVEIQKPTVGSIAQAAEPERATEIPADADDAEEVSEGTNPTEATIGIPPVTVYASEKLAAAIELLELLEDNRVIGTVTKVDVSDVYDLQLWYEDRYQVFFGDNSRLRYKIEAMKNAIGQMTDYQRGELDVSFTLRPTEVVYTPFGE